MAAKLEIANTAIIRIVVEKEDFFIGNPARKYDTWHI
jgi:hypothetical protein